MSSEWKYTCKKCGYEYTTSFGKPQEGSTVDYVEEEAKQPCPKCGAVKWKFDSV